MLPIDIQVDNEVKRVEQVEHEIQIALAPPARTEETRLQHLKLYRFALDGLWIQARDEIFNKHSNITATDRITKQGDTALHVAVAANRAPFVKGLVEEHFMKAEDLAIKNFAGKTALHYAASFGNLGLVKFMVEKMDDSVMIPDEDGKLPLHMAALSGRGEIVEYLYVRSNIWYLNTEDKMELLVALINSDLYDVALDLFLDDNELAFSRDRNGETALHALARKSTVSSNLSKQDQQGIKFLLAYVGRFFKLFSDLSPCRCLSDESTVEKLIRCIWDRVIRLDEPDIAELIRKPKQLIFDVAEKGNFIFLQKLVYGYPDIIWELNSDGRNIFHIAVLYRQESILNLIHDIGPIKYVVTSATDNKGNNILHLAGIQAPQNRLESVVGEVLQMQKEVSWFKKVRSMMQQSDIESLNNDGKTPAELFSDSHKDLKEKGRKWMKDTANSCMVVATLVATVVFAAAFTIPGGSKEDTGAPIFLKEVSFKIFALSDAVSLIFSSISILSFLSIFAFKYEDIDFFSVLPNHLLIGLISLCLSIVSMMVVFCATSFIIFNGETLWIPIIITLLAPIPVIWFILEHSLFIVQAGFNFRSLVSILCSVGCCGLFGFLVVFWFRS